MPEESDVPTSIERALQAVTCDTCGALLRNDNTGVHKA